jgi:hypothetical protein
MYRSRRFLALLLLLILASAGAIGCGDDDSGGSQGGDSGSAWDSASEGDTGLPPSAPPEEPGSDCPSDVPTKVDATDPGYNGWLVLCASDDRSTLQIENTSGNSFAVWPTDEGTQLEMTHVPSTVTFAGYLASLAVPPGDNDGNGTWALPPDSTLVATNDYGAASVQFQLNIHDTAAFNAAHSSAAYVDGLGVSRSRALVEKGLACADSAADAAKEQERLDLALDAIRVRTTCKGFLDDALQREGQALDDTQSAWRRFLANAERLAGGNWDDELVYGIARFARR